MRIAYIFPSRERQTKFFAALENIKTLSASDNYTVICVLDLDDEKMNNDEVKERLRQYENVEYYYGFSENKVDAINKQVNKIPEDTDIIILMSDDMIFLVKGFDDVIRKDMQENFPDMDGALHYPDGSPASEVLITMSIMGKKYFDRFGYLYYPEYKNVYCDLEFFHVAKRLGKYKFVNNQIFEHLHPIWRKGEMDELYKRNEEPISYKKDHELFTQRQLINFGL